MFFLELAFLLCFGLGSHPRPINLFFKLRINIILGPLLHLLLDFDLHLLQPLSNPRVERSHVRHPVVNVCMLAHRGGQRHLSGPDHLQRHVRHQRLDNRLVRSPHLYRAVAQHIARELQGQVRAFVGVELDEREPGRLDVRQAVGVGLGFEVAAGGYAHNLADGGHEFSELVLAQLRLEVAYIHGSPDLLLPLHLGLDNGLRVRRVVFVWNRDVGVEGDELQVRRDAGH
mmetsp:Transcript_27164/g.48019  ORF Transcript_27164/g.48019 Transcript_27164/m.48019 type:complete len:229 (-) Transcript_27164:1324-2010(-)